MHRINSKRKNMRSLFLTVIMGFFMLSSANIAANISDIDQKDLNVLQVQGDKSDGTVNALLIPPKGSSPVTLALASIEVNAIEKEYTNEEALFIASSTNHVDIKLALSYATSLYDETGNVDITLKITSSGSSVPPIVLPRVMTLVFQQEQRLYTDLRDYVTLNVPLTAALRTFLNNAYASNRDVSFQVTVNSESKILDTLPVFAENDDYMNPNTVVENVTYKGICPGESDYSKAKMDVVGTYEGSSVAYTDACVDIAYFPNVKKFKMLLTSGSGAISEEIHYTLGTQDLTIVAPSVDKDNLYIESVTLKLPQGHSIHGDNSADGTVYPYGTNTVLLENPAGNVIASNNGLANMSFSGVMDNKYLHGGNLPFYFKLDSYLLNASGLYFPDTHIRYAYKNAENDKKSNVQRFSNPDSANIDVVLRDTGIRVDQNILFNSVASLQAHYPQISMNSGDFLVSVIDSKLTNVQIQQPDININMDYNKNCMGSGCSDVAQSNHMILNNIVSTVLYADGSVVSKHAGAIGAVEWGYNGSDTVFSRTNDEDAQIFIPGFELASSEVEEVVPLLLGTAEEKEDNMLVYHDLNTVESKKGRNLFAGINVGKLQIDGLDISAAAGTSLAAKPMTVQIAFPAVEKVLQSNAYSKYYVRPSGITGVFNREPVAFSANVYGYPMNFSQFAFKQVANKTADHSLINGDIHVGGKGDFDVAFKSLVLACDGGLEKGLVVPCDSSVENAVNCSEELNAWKIATDFSNIGFVGEGECAVTKKLEVGHILDVRALKERIGLSTVWTASGLPVQSRVSSSAYNQLDGNTSLNAEVSNNGYEVAFDDTVKLASSASNDWFEANVKFGLPFWNAANMSIRLKNATVTSKEPSVVVAKGALSSFDMEKSNEEIVRDIVNDYRQDVAYTWAGFINFNMPVYYDARDSMSKIPQFLGRTQSVDLKVMSAKSGVDYINPESTSMSFGASADFEALGKMKLHIDLNDPESLRNIDNVLVDDFNIFSRNSEGKGPFEGSIGEVVENIHIGNKLLGEGLTLGMEEAAILALEEGSKQLGNNDPFENIAQIVSTVHAIPALINDRIETEVKGRILFALNESFGITEKMFEGLVPNPDLTYEKFAESHDSEISEIKTKLTDVQTALDGYKDTVTFLKDMKETLSVMNTLGTRIDEAKTMLNTYLKDPDTQECSWDYTANYGVFKPVGKATKAITDVNKKLQDFKISKIEDIAKKVNNFTGLDSKDLTSLAKKIKKWSNTLDEMVNEKSGAFHTQFKSIVCNNMGEVETALNDITERARPLLAMQNDISDKITAILAVMDETGDVGKYVYAMDDIAQNLKEALDAMSTNETAMTDGALDSLVTVAVGNMDIFPGSQITGMSSLKQALYTDINTKLDDEVFDKTDALVTMFETTVPNLSASDMRRLAVTKLFATQAVQELNAEFQEMLSPIADEVDKIAMELLGGLDRSLNKLLASVSKKVNDSLNKATSKMANAMPVKAAKMDGYAIVRGQRLSQAHIGAEFEVKGSSDKSSFTLNAALDMWNDSIDGTSGCTAGNESSNLNVQISTRDIEMPLGPKTLSVDLVLLGMALDGDNGAPKGIFGGITSKKGMEFESFKLYNLGLATGIGQSETYLGAKGAAKLDDVQLGVNFLVGHVCNKTIQKAMIPENIYKFITIPDSGFTGGMVYGEAQVPVWKNGCMLTVNARAKLGAWYLFNGNADIYGGIAGGGIFGKGLCIATLGGEMEALAEKAGDRVRFQGSGWGAAGVGSCDNSWDSVSDSRSDSWCGTGDAQFGAIYDNGWELLEIKFSAVH